MPSIDVAAAQHANRHRTGAPDALTPADIGASPSGHAHSWDQITDKPANSPPSAHVASHAPGGSDPIAPASIGAAPLYSGSTGPAMPVESGSYTGHVDEQTVPGVYRVASSAMNATNGYPPTPNTTGTLVVQTSFSQAYLVQTVYSNRNEVIWTRARAAGTWHPWVKFATEQDTGWREMPVDTWIAESAFPNISKQRLRRVGNTVWAGLQFEYEAGSYSYRPTATPVGFRPDLSAFSASVSGYSGDPIQIGVFGVNSSGTTFLRMRSGISSGVNGYFTTSWLTSDPWPNTLPGTPV